MRGFSIIAFTLGLAGISGAQNWNLAGKVRDAEEGNGLGSVQVRLVKAGLSTTTAKNGDWSLVAGVGVGPRSHARSRSGENFLHLEQGRLLLRMGGVDLLGRSVAGVEGAFAPLPAAGRSTAAVDDTLVYSREGFHEKRVPVVASDLAGILDSIRRIRYEGWVDSSHSNGFAPDTTDTFVDTLRKITFRFAKADWDSMMKTMADTCGEFGKSGGFGMGTQCQKGQYDLINNNALIWVPVEMLADGQVWRKVAIRLKGNASLMTSWSNGSYSLPFRINMDKFEDEFPVIKNQRFHGFKKLSFYNMEQDSSGIRGALASEIFREAGVVAPMSVPVQLFLDRGDGSPLDIGIYEMLEIPDNPLLNRWFGNDSGDLYKPLSKLDSYVESEWFDEDVEGDYSDVKELISVINSTNRTSDPAAWRRQLEMVLDVEGFLRWLAVSTAIMNWDAYGTLAHNYYVFNDRGIFRWITYDFGWSFDYAMNLLPRNTIWYDQSSGGGFGMNYGPFPLVKNLLADPQYCGTYRKAMETAIAADGPLTEASFQEKVDRYGKWMQPFPVRTSAVTKLRGFWGPRLQEIRSSLAQKTCPQ
ncbi:MAG: CotH kinase family protein [Fibrobacteria bacterium]|nr:CotH kinase family protein [Fibrobacteria bacterium]